MRRAISVLVTALVCACSLHAVEPAIRDIGIDIRILQDGSAEFTEVWNVTVASGTEWYLVKSNLDHMRVTDLAVSDETGRNFKNIGAWDIHRSLGEKAGKCGIVTKDNGCELCWGVGSYGDHTFTVSYKMTGVIIGRDDSDYMHLQLVSPGLSARPGHVKVTVSSDTPLSNINTRLWGFGFEGTANFADGTLVTESSRRLGSDESVILLAKFNKNLFTPSVSESGEFQAVLDRALEGASYEDDVEQGKSTFREILSYIFATAISILGWIVVPFYAIFGARRRNRRKVLGCKMSEVSWCRDIPFSGNILDADYVLTQLGEDKKKNTIASAMILRMIKNGNLTVSRDKHDRVEISFNDAGDRSSLFQCERDLYAMMKEASGKDLILQHNEVSRWSSRHTSRVSAWVQAVKAESEAGMKARGYVIGRQFTDAGQEQARATVGFRKYLQDFTIINERQSAEVQLWHEYLVFAALYGIADKVAKELKEINPEAFNQMMVYDYNTMNDVVILTRNLADNITNAYAAHTMGGNDGGFSPSRGGFGGFTSIGGGGGFHGGGFGGGSR